jgi:predicted glycosyl hydrolase (DUF1957 family)
MITKDNRDLPILEITPENYLVPKGEEKFYHVRMESKSFDQHSGKRLSHPFIQKFSRVDFEGGMMSVLRQQGYDMVILHDPKAWMEQHADELNKKKARKAEEAKAKAEAEKKALKEQIRQELLAEMKAEAEAKKKKSESKKSAKEETTPADEAPSAVGKESTDNDLDLS